MTREGQGTGPEQTPLPPTRTQRSGGGADEDTGMLPPFVPGRRGPAESAPVPESVPEPETPGDEPRDPWSEPADSDPADSDPWAESALESQLADGAEVDLESIEEPDWEPEADEESEPWGAPEAGAAAGPAAEPWSSEGGAASGDGTADLADRLESLAGKLRSEGSAGVEAEMGSADRVTALLAGFLAGYLAGRES